MIDNAPINPTAATKLCPIVDITMATTIVIRMRACTNDFE
jgi:hypothetical protein